MGSLSLLDWRRRVASLYAAVRAESDPAVAHEHWRRGRDELLRNHRESPIPVGERDGFTGVPIAPYDPSFRFEVDVDTSVAPEHLAVQTGTDGVVRFDRIGRVALPGVGDLDVWWLAAYGGGVFLPLRDALAGSRTYGGGRYVLDTVKGADLGGTAGRLLVDLNFAYNPSCAYDPAWACPLAPPGNVVTADVPVGEMLLAGARDRPSTRESANGRGTTGRRGDEGDRRARRAR